MDSFTLGAPTRRRPIPPCSVRPRLGLPRPGLPRPGLPRPAPPCAPHHCAPPRPALPVVYPGFGFDTYMYIYIYINIYLSNPKPGNTTGGTVRCGAQQSGGARRSGVGRDADRSVRPGDTQPSCIPGHRKQLSWTTLRKHEQTQFYLNRWGNVRAVDARCIRWTKPPRGPWRSSTQSSAPKIEDGEGSFDLRTR